MVFDKLHIQNFKGIQELRMEGLGAINFIVGKNNGGKSTVLDAIYLLAHQGDPRSIVDIYAVRNTEIAEGDNFKYLFPKANVKVIPAIYGRYGDVNKGIEIQAFNGDLSRYTFLGKVDRTMPVDGIRIDFDYYQDDEFQNPVEYKPPLNSGRLYYNNIFGEVVFDKSLKYKYPNIKEDDVISVLYVPSYPSHNKLLQYAKSIVFNKQKAIVIDALQEFDSSFIDFQIFGDEILIDNKNWDTLASLPTMGEGFVKLFAILLAIINSANGICLIDEIENGLHHSVLKNNWQHILNAAEKHNVQLFITTHNAEILEAVTKVATAEQQKGICLHRVEKNKEDKHFALNYNFESIVRMIENGNELRGW